MTLQRPEHDDEAVARLLAALPPAPPAWVEAAATLPQTRRDAERIVALAEADREFRAALTADPGGALRDRGYEPTRGLLDAVTGRLESR